MDGVSPATDGALIATTPFPASVFTGVVLARFDATGFLAIAQPAVAGVRLTARLLSLDLASSRVRWSLPLDASGNATLLERASDATGGAPAFIVATPGCVACVRAADGIYLWLYCASSGSLRAAAVGPLNVYALASNQTSATTVLAISQLSGTTVWARKISAGADAGSSVLVPNNALSGLLAGAVTIVRNESVTLVMALGVSVPSASPVPAIAALAEKGSSAALATTLGITIGSIAAAIAFCVLGSFVFVRLRNKSATVVPEAGKPTVVPEAGTPSIATTPSLAGTPSISAVTIAISETVAPLAVIMGPTPESDLDAATAASAAATSAQELAAMRARIDALDAIIAANDQRAARINAPFRARLNVRALQTNSHAEAAALASAGGWASQPLNTVERTEQGGTTPLQIPALRTTRLLRRTGLNLNGVPGR